MQGIYIHIPFCKQACNYCDFHFSTQLDNKTLLVNALCGEIELRHDYLQEKKLDSIYFGGGTPSLLSKEELSQIFSSLKKYFSWDEKAEITLEANPDDLTKEKLKELKDLGINRLSIGLQSFNEDELKWMNRAHTAIESENCIRDAQAAGFNNISIDLIYGSKFQTLQSWEETLQKAIDLNVQHISSYNLTVENKTALGHAVKKGNEPLIDDEKSSKQFLMMIEALEKNGFIHYEISNFGKKGFFAVHNSNYWKGCHYLGIGPAAHSFNGVSRQWNINNNSAYINAIKNSTPFFETEILTVNNKYNEYVLTGLRTIWGCNLDHIKNNFSEVHADYFLNKIKKYLKGEVVENETIFTLTKKGKLLADKIAMELFI